MKTQQTLVQLAAAIATSWLMLPAAQANTAEQGVKCPSGSTAKISDGNKHLVCEAEERIERASVCSGVVFKSNGDINLNQRIEMISTGSDVCRGVTTGATDDTVDDAVVAPPDIVDDGSEATLTGSVTVSKGEPSLFAVIVEAVLRLIAATPPIIVSTASAIVVGMIGAIRFRRRAATGGGGSMKKVGIPGIGSPSGGPQALFTLRRRFRKLGEGALFEPRNGALVCVDPVGEFSIVHTLHFGHRAHLEQQLFNRLVVGILREMHKMVRYFKGGTVAVVELIEALFVALIYPPGDVLGSGIVGIVPGVHVFAKGEIHRQHWATDALDCHRGKAVLPEARFVLWPFGQRATTAGVVAIAARLNDRIQLLKATFQARSSAADWWANEWAAERRGEFVVGINVVDQVVELIHFGGPIGPSPTVDTAWAAPVAAKVIPQFMPG